MSISSTCKIVTSQNSSRHCKEGLWVTTPRSTFHECSEAPGYWTHYLFTPLKYKRLETCCGNLIFCCSSDVGCNTELFNLLKTMCGHAVWSSATLVTHFTVFQPWHGARAMCLLWKASLLNLALFWQWILFSSWACVIRHDTLQVCSWKTPSLPANHVTIRVTPDTL